MKKTLFALAAFGAFAVPALAQAADVKCSAFTSMDSKAQMATIDSLPGLMPAGDMMESDKMGSDKMASDNMSSDKMESDKMASDKMGADKMGSDKMASDKMASDKMGSDKMASTDKMGGDMSTTDLTMKVSSYCLDHPDMMVTDALK